MSNRSPPFHHPPPGPRKNEATARAVAGAGDISSHLTPSSSSHHGSSSLSQPQQSGVLSSSSGRSTAAPTSPSTSTLAPRPRPDALHSSNSTTEAPWGGDASIDARTPLSPDAGGEGHDADPRVVHILRQPHRDSRGTETLTSSTRTRSSIATTAHLRGSTSRCSGLTNDLLGNGGLSGTFGPDANALFSDTANPLAIEVTDESDPHHPEPKGGDPADQREGPAASDGHGNHTQQRGGDSPTLMLHTPLPPSGAVDGGLDWHRASADSAASFPTAATSLTDTRQSLALQINVDARRGSLDAPVAHSSLPAGHGHGGGPPPLITDPIADKAMRAKLLRMPVEHLVDEVMRLRGMLVYMRRQSPPFAPAQAQLSDSNYNPLGVSLMSPGIVGARTPRSHWAASNPWTLIDRTIERIAAQRALTTAVNTPLVSPSASTVQATSSSTTLDKSATFNKSGSLGHQASQHFSFINNEAISCDGSDADDKSPSHADFLSRISSRGVLSNSGGGNGHRTHKRRSKDSATAGSSRTSAPIVKLIVTDECDAGGNHNSNAHPYAGGTKISQKAELVSDLFEMLNDYVLIDEIGAGQYGRVLLAAREGSTAKYVVKVVSKTRIRRRFLHRHSTGLESTWSGTAESPSHGHAPASVDQAFEREIAVMKKLKHRNIVRLEEVIDDPDDDNVYLVMPYIERGPVVRLESGVCAPLEIDVVRGYMRQLLSAVAYLHRNQVVHCDIKPDNILLGADGCVYLTDFGVSEIFSGATEEEGADAMHVLPGAQFNHANAGSRRVSEEVTNSEMTLATTKRVSIMRPDQQMPMRRPSIQAPMTMVEGFQLRATKTTPAFAAPETLTGASFNGAKADVWSAGVTMFVMLFGRLPFGGESVFDLYANVQAGRVSYAVLMTAEAGRCLERMLRPGSPGGPADEEPDDMTMHEVEVVCALRAAVLAHGLARDEDDDSPIPAASNAATTTAPSRRRASFDSSTSTVCSPHSGDGAGAAAVRSVPVRLSEADLRSVGFDRQHGLVKKYYAALELLCLLIEPDAGARISARRAAEHPFVGGSTFQRLRGLRRESISRQSSLTSGGGDDIPTASARGGARSPTSMRVGTATPLKDPPGDTKRTTSLPAGRLGREASPPLRPVPPPNGGLKMGFTAFNSMFREIPSGDASDDGGMIAFRPLEVTSPIGGRHGLSYGGRSPQQTGLLDVSGNTRPMGIDEAPPSIRTTLTSSDAQSAVSSRDRRREESARSEINRRAETALGNSSNRNTPLHLALVPPASPKLLGLPGGRRTPHQSPLGVHLSPHTPAFEPLCK